ncbi:DUF2497 domain-containing protein [Wolbachia endosymbiont of Folsomia candida]|uniref:DUF2497 domain-containing protein n=1 Tax=Wolbachia endosymbiont of Folsomia candida TaxID=169402 RepID=UPI000DBEFC0F|nr:DUF2497 domain-containing protein [Wolbachia endosymbiont of Folsomia candida]AWW50829.1 DUF2497 domain-containing protein [Wolbachia endosymbiont of Folsomia candida]
MSDEQGNQSVKDILEDIKKAISGKNTGDEEELDDANEDLLYLEDEYLEDTEEESDEEDSEEEDDNNDPHNEGAIFNNHQRLSSNSHNNLEEKKEVFSHNNIKMSSSNSGLQPQNNDHLILKENMQEIKTLLGKMQSELQHQQQQKRPNLTIEELVTSLLKPQLSEWLNQHLYKLVKEVVEKELKDIINNNK